MSKVTQGIINKRENASHAMEMDDYNKLIDGLRSDKLYQWEAYAILAFVTALRGEDVLTLRWKDALHKNTIHFVEDKTEKVRTINLNKSVRSRIKEIWELDGKRDPNELVMLSRATYKRTGKESAYSIQYINRRLKVFKFKYKLDIPLNRFSTHTFRKTFGKYVYESNGKSFESLNILNMIFGHANITMTQKYIGVTGEAIDNIYETIKI